MCSLDYAKKSLGQHFLINRTICKKIVEALEISPEDNVLEIGPGPGALSTELFNTPCERLVFIEKDNRFAQNLKQRACGNCEILEQDALKFEWSKLNGQWKILGNLPYNIASPLIWDILSQVRGLKKAVFMVQLEVALRLTARTDTKAYGALSVWVQNFSIPSLIMKIAPGSFRPPPKVDSAVVSFTPLPDCKKPQDPEKLQSLLHICFQNRRKQLGAIFNMRDMPFMLYALKKYDIPPTLRPENLSPLNFRSLASCFP